MDEVTIAQQQDALRPLRMFVGLVGGALQGYDQSRAAEDGYSWNAPGQFQVIGPYGVAAEGTPIRLTNAGGLYISPMLILMGLGAAAVLLFKK